MIMEYVMYFRFVDDVMSYNGPNGVWHWQYLRQLHSGASCHKFPTYSLGGATVFDFVVACNGSKLRTGALAITTRGALPLASGLCNKTLLLIKPWAKFAFDD